MKRIVTLSLTLLALTLGACAHQMGKDESMKKEEMMKKEEIMKKEEMKK